MHRRSITVGLAVGQSGQALVEFALVLPVMLILVLGSIDIGRALVYGVAVQDGAREAARLGATAAVDDSATDTVILNRLIAASAPALGGCTPITTTQSCGGGTWTFTIEDVTTDPATSVVRTYTNLLNDGDDGNCGTCEATPEVGSAEYARVDANFPGSKVTVTATGSVSMLAGFSTIWGMTLFPITVRGQAAMMVI